MSRFLLLAEDASGLGLGLRLKTEGHSVKLWTRDPRFKDVGRGLVDCAGDYEFGQIVIAECIGFGSLCDLMRDHGIRTFAGSSFADHIEEDRELAEEVMHDCDIETPKSKRATSWSEAASLVSQFSSKGDSGKVVIKPEGKLSGIMPSYVASSVEDGIAMLKSFEQQSGTTEPELVVQEFIEGVAVSTEGWFNGQEWCEGMFNHTLENKKTLNDDLGPSAGCAGNVVWASGSDSPLVTETLTKLTERLREACYVGPLDVNCVVNKKGIYALEFTPRFGYDAFPTLLYTLCDFGFGDFVDRCSSGQLCTESLSEGFGAGVRLSIVIDEDHQSTALVSGLSEEELESFYPYHLCLNNKEELESVKKCDMLGVMTGKGDSIGEAFARAYLLCQKAQIRDVQFRTDLCESTLKDYRDLREVLFDEEQSWLGVDLDGTLAEYSTWSTEIGKPISKMVQRVKSWIRQGHDVRVFTARGSVGSGLEQNEQLVEVYDWIKEHIGTPLEVTHKKDPLMLRLYDDRVRQIEANTGELLPVVLRS